jgi:ADP-ribosyl-[dinitrogen reductase] hydrolase
MDIKGMIIGGAVGDALGMPVENKTRMDLIQNPITEMISNEAYNLPVGTFSDDTSMTWMLAEAIADGYDMKMFADKMVRWYKHGDYTATGIMIDIKQTVAKALDRYIKTGKLDAGAKTEGESGSGSLMRIAPMILVTKGKKIDERIEIIREQSALTHAHAIPILSCFFLTEFLLELHKSNDKIKAYALAQNKLKYVFNKGISRSVQNKFERLYPNRVWSYGEGEMETARYSIFALETALWCFFNTKSYKEAVLTAVNFGGDTDTVAAITGSIAGMYYGYESIPLEWRKTLLKADELEALAERLQTIFK